MLAISPYFQWFASMDPPRQPPFSDGGEGAMAGSHDLAGQASSVLYLLLYDAHTSGFDPKQTLAR
jgi:hypothetical protein